MPAHSDVFLLIRGNFMWAINRNAHRKVALTYQVVDLEDDPVLKRQSLGRGEETALGVIEAADGQIFRYRQVMASYEA
jgi:hypothetical protein